MLPSAMTFAAVLLALAAQAAESPRTGRAIVLELFTSQGCSSCPPADAILNRLGVDPATRQSVIPLAFHVDYWNEGGWTDPFSSHEWTERQAAYGRAFGLNDLYTPQLVVDGRVQFTGGDEARVRSEIAAGLAREPPASVRLSVRRSPDARPALEVEVSAAVEGEIKASKLKTVLVLFENGRTTTVAAGENNGRELKNDFVVRRLQPGFALDVKVGARRQQAFTMKLDPAWTLDNVGVAAFLQDPSSMRIYGAAVVQHVE